MSETATTPTAAPPATPTAPAAPSVGDPFALGLASFGVSALVLASVMSGLIDASSTPAVLSLAFAFGFFVELVAGVLHFARGETFAGMVFTAYAGFWLSYGLLVQFFLPDVAAAGGDAGAIVGMFLLAWAVFSAYMLLASVRTTRTVTSIFVLLTLVFALASLGSFQGSAGTSHLAGWVLFADAALALYLSAATVTAATWGRQVLPAP